MGFISPMIARGVASAIGSAIQPPDPMVLCPQQVAASPADDPTARGAARAAVAVVPFPSAPLAVGRGTECAAETLNEVNSRCRNCRSSAGVVCAPGCGMTAAATSSPRRGWAIAKAAASAMAGWRSSPASVSAGETLLTTKVDPSLPGGRAGTGSHLRRGCRYRPCETSPL